jgi:hypothetical protein
MMIVMMLFRTAHLLGAFCYCIVSAFSALELPALAPPSQLVVSYNDDHSVTLRWQAVPTARYYRFQISEVRDFSVVRTDAMILQARSWVRATVAGLDPDREYWWRVQSIADAIESAWSAPVRIQMERWVLGVPEELLPSDGATLAFGGVRLSWRPCERATSYCLQLAQSPRFDDDVIEVETAQSWIVEHRCAPGKNYYWRVRAKRGTAMGEWSPVQRFTVVPITVSALREHEHMRNTQLKLLANGEAETPITFLTNPATGQLTVRSMHEHCHESSIVLFDVFGRRVVEQSIRPGECAVTIAVSHLPNGSYTLHVRSKDTLWVGTVDLLRYDATW